jgi:hypothetical protein
MSKEKAAPGVHRDLDAASVEIAIFISVNHLYLLSSIKRDVDGIIYYLLPSVDYINSVRYFWV